MAALIHRVGDMDYETWVTAEEAFEIATIGSARSCGLADEIGTIEVGRKADLVLLDREDYGFIPLFKPIQQLAYAVNSEAVRTVLAMCIATRRGLVIGHKDAARDAPAGGIDREAGGSSPL